MDTENPGDRVVSAAGSESDKRHTALYGRQYASRHSAVAFRGGAAWTHGYRRYRVSYSDRTGEYLESRPDQADGRCYCAGNVRRGRKEWIWPRVGSRQRSALVAHGGNVWRRSLSCWSDGPGDGVRFPGR